MSSARADLAEDLAKNLPRWVGWIPVVGKASYRWWISRRRRRSAEYNVAVRFDAARIEVGASDEGTLHLKVTVTNFGSRVVEVDRLELHNLGVGGRNLNRKSDMIKMTGQVPARRSQEMVVGIDLHGADIRHIVQGVNKALNPLSTPQASVNVYADVVCLGGKERFRKTIQQSVTNTDCQIAGEAISAHLPAESQ